MIKKQLDIIKKCSKYNNVFIYGAGYYGRITKAYLDERNINVRGFIVTNIEISTIKPTVLETPVYDIEYLSHFCIEEVYIIIAADEKNHNNMIKNILEKNVFYYSCIDRYILNDFYFELCFSKKYATRNNINVFLYHRVGNCENNNRGLIINNKLFEKQLIYIKENYKILKSDEDWDNNKDKSAVITFDDGCKDFFYIFLPLLEKYEIPGTVFVTTGNIDTSYGIWGDELEWIIFNSMFAGTIYFEGHKISFENKEKRKETFWQLRTMLKKMNKYDRKEKIIELSKALKIKLNNKNDFHRVMTSEEIRKCSKSPFVTIGAHTVNHCCLANEDKYSQWYEMETSKNHLENIIGKEVSVFAYPYGEKDDFTDETVKIAKKIGYKRVFAAYKGLANSKTEYGKIPRIDISKNMNFEESVRDLKITELCYLDDYI